MIRVIVCATHQHDYRMVLLAALVCAIACGTTTQMLPRAASSAATRGDQVLVEAGAQVRHAIREMDTAARLGGDEFAASQREAASLAARLLAELSRSYDIDGHQVMIGASIGIALFPGDGHNSTTLMKNADLALYRAKRDGRGVFGCFEQEMDARVQERRAMEQNLRQAIARGELALNYQPLVKSRTLEITGFEALLRWTHPVRGQVPPSNSFRLPRKPV